ncbi:MAG: ribbon-helix-helix protein, CopG family [Nitrososphaeria archaeon]|nr:ribbon-helix-helix protein, CopG family [Nitrososphaeria archaeon]
MKKYTVLPVPTELVKEIDERAVKTGLYVSVSEFIREAIRQRIIELNDLGKKGYNS